MSGNVVGARRQRMGGVIIMLMGWGLMGGGGGAAWGEEAKATPPTMMAQLGALKTVQNVYKDDLAAAKTSELKKALVRKLVEDSKGEKGVNRYALLATAVDIAGEVGDLAGALPAIEAIDASFNVDALKMKADAATAAGMRTRTAEDRKMFAEQTRGVIASALAADRYDLGRAMAELALGMARATTDADLARRAAVEAQQVRDLESVYAEVKKALLVLADSPTDADANLKVGRYRCLVKGDWAAGLPMLALGSDAALKALAEKEVAGVSATDEQVKLGDGWWDYSEPLKGLEKSSVRNRAAKWYQEALPAMGKGFIKLKVESRIKDVQAESKPESSGLLERPRVAVIKAVYGTAKKNVDVTKTIAGAVSDVGLIFSVDNSIGSDVAPGEHKQLALNCTLQGQTISKRMEEGELFVLLGPIRTERKGTVVLKALYGAGCTWKNVTPMLQAAADKKEAPFKVTDEVMGGDPKFEAQKFCVVVFFIDGKPGWTAARMGEIFPLPLKLENTK